MPSATPSGRSSQKSRRLDSHQHEAVYGTAAFLNRATSATSRSAPIRTVSSGFGDRLLSQEHTPNQIRNTKLEIRNKFKTRNSKLF